MLQAQRVRFCLLRFEPLAELFCGHDDGKKRLPHLLNLGRSPRTFNDLFHLRQTNKQTNNMKILKGAAAREARAMHQSKPSMHSLVKAFEKLCN